MGGRCVLRGCELVGLIGFVLGLRGVCRFRVIIPGHGRVLPSGCGPFFLLSRLRLNPVQEHRTRASYQEPLGPCLQRHETGLYCS